MYISTNNYSAEAAQMLKEAESTSKKSLIDYMNENKDSKASGYFSDTLSLSSGAYAALKDYDPDFLNSLGYDEEKQTGMSSSGSSLDKVQLSEEAVAALRESNPAVLRALGYEIPEE